MKSPDLYIFACGGVVFSEQCWTELFAWLSRSGVQQLRTLGPHAKTGLDKFLRGKISEEEFWESISADWGSPIKWKNLFNWFYVTRYMPGVRDVISDLRKKGRRVVAGSNVLAPCCARNEKNGMYSLFSKCYFSCEMQVAKPDPVFYETILRSEDVAPGDALYIGTATENIESARRVGLRVYRFRGAVNLRAKLVNIGALDA